MCPNCGAFSEQRTFKTPEDYVAFVRRLIAETSSGSFVLIYGDCALEELKDAPPWPAEDVIRHELQCIQCSQFFSLSVNVWNGRNSWELQSAKQWAADRPFYIR